MLDHTRRKFLMATAAGTLLATTTSIVTSKRAEARSKTDTITGSGDFQYRVDHEWAELPDRFSWQTTHNVAVDSANNLYVIHEGRKHNNDHPSIFVFDPQGKFVRAFGSQFQGGGHGIEIRREGSEEFIYVAAYQHVKSFAKLTLTGEIVWYKKAPVESGKYAKGEEISTSPNWSRQGFLPTNFAFLDDGGFLLADGYGSFQIHRFDKDAKWVSCFGGAGEGKGTFNTSHGLWIDRRNQEPQIVVTDRAHNSLQFFSLDGKYLKTIEGFGLPANIDIRDSIMMVPELKAQVNLLNEKNEVVARLGSGQKRLDSIKDLRNKSGEWVPGEFVHPHDACFDNEGNIFVAEWVNTGRVTKLTKVSG